MKATQCFYNNMAIKQLYLNGFSHHLCGSASRNKASELARRACELGGLSTLAGRFFSNNLLASAPGSRNRDFPLLVTFWAFFSQVLTRNASCRAAVAGVQAWRASRNTRMPSDGTSAYCQARSRLPLDCLRAIFTAIGAWISKHDSGDALLNGRIVRVVDGTGVSMPDTAANRKKWPCAGNQKPGCGFPVIQLAGLFCLQSGRLIKFAFGSWKERESVLARQLVGWLGKGEVLLADRGFCGWGFMALLQRKGVDVVFRLQQFRKNRPGRHVWEKPRRTESWGKRLWRELPAQITVRILSFDVHVKGFRSRRITLCTSLLDSKAYPDEALIALYMRRWKIELFFRDIKTTLGLDVVRCQTPAMVEKEIWMQAIAYNTVRALMLEAALSHGVSVERLSFKGTVDMMRTWAGCMHHDKPGINKHLLSELLLAIASEQVPLRPCRAEPRCRKRRPKDYQYLTKPRHAMAPFKLRRKKMTTSALI